MDKCPIKSNEQKLKHDLHFKFTAALWKSTGQGAWYFVTLPKAPAEQIRFFSSANTTVWGAVRVSVSIGKTRWNTSLFLDKKSGYYFLPIKAPVAQERENPCRGQGERSA